MSNPYVGEIRIFAGNFAPVGWALCDGQLMPIAENDTLFTLIGTTYGGDGESTFGLPDLRGRIPVHNGQGPGQPFYQLGQNGGVEAVTLTTAQLPNHTHPMLATSDAATQTSPASGVLATTTIDIFRTQAAPNTAMSPQSVQPTGGSQPHANIMPYQCLNFIISLFGVFPSRN